MEKRLASLAGWNARLVLDAMHGARWEGGQHESWNSSPPFAWCSGVAAGIGSHGSAIAGADAEERVGTHPEGSGMCGRAEETCCDDQMPTNKLTRGILVYEKNANAEADTK